MLIEAEKLGALPFPVGAESKYDSHLFSIVFQELFENRPNFDRKDD